MDNFDRQEIIRTLSSLNNTAVTKCVIYLANEERNISSFLRGLKSLLTAKNSFDLTSVETSFQLAIDEIKGLRKSGCKSWTQNKTALYLYALQYIILHLNEITLPNQENTYKSRLGELIQNINQKCQDLGVDPAIMHQQCYDTSYRSSTVGILHDFALIDINNVNNFNIRLEKYKTTHKNEDLYETGTYHKLSRQKIDAQPQKNETNSCENFMKELSNEIKKIFHFENLNLKIYNEQCIQINNEIRKLCKQSNKDIKTANAIIRLFVQYLTDKENNPDFETSRV